MAALICSESKSKNIKFFILFGKNISYIMSSDNSIRAFRCFGSYGTSVKVDVTWIKIKNVMRTESLKNKAYVISIDVSGSMENEDRLISVKAGVKAQLNALVSILSKKKIYDMTKEEKNSYLSPKYIGHLAIYTFSNEVQLIYSNYTHPDKNPWDLVEELEPLYQTDLYRGISIPLEKIIELDENNIVSTFIVLTDGFPTVGLRDIKSYKSLFERIPRSTNFITVGVGNSYESRLIDLEPANFNHAHNQPNLVEFAASTLYHFVNSYGHSAEICSEGDPLSYTPIIGQIKLGTLFKDVERLTVLTDIEEDDLTLCFIDFAGNKHEISLELSQQEFIPREIIETYYRQRTVWLKHQLHLEGTKIVQKIKDEMDQWIYDEYSKPFKDELLEQIGLLDRNKHPRREDLLCSSQSLSASRNQSSYTSASGDPYYQPHYLNDD